jgi:hypothetical protein
MRAFHYPPTQYVRRHGPRGYADVESYRPWLRDEFAFRCVYCLFREQWGRVKAGFSLDHFLPVSTHPQHEHDYDNLLYTCVACNLAKGITLIPDPTQVFVEGAVHVHEDGRIEGLTPAARRLIRLLGLDGREETEARLLWIGIIALAEQADPELYQRLMGFPDNLPDLRRLRPPGGNGRPDGVVTCYHAQRRMGPLPATY